MGLKRLVAALLGFLSVLLLSIPAANADSPARLDGETLFSQHCAGCHINGGNIIRRSKNLKLATLQRRGLDSVDAIAKIAREGVGQMGGYGDVLGVDGNRVVATWVLDQAQNAWIQG